MKKILALVLVLGMASMANAAITLQVQDDLGQWVEAVSSEIFLLPTETIVLGVHEDQSIPGGFNAWVGIPEQQIPLGEWTGNSAVVAPPALANAAWITYGPTPYYGYNYWTLRNSTTDTSIVTEPGIAATLEFHCKELGPVDIHYGYNGPGDPSTRVLTIHQIPEPMTMALLGLGGLALIRRRR